ncbi:glutaredoxin family protein [Psychrobacter aestuarii]|uniref:Thioredoxin family protein n=1 Tax=Psychrobacter aestuarii TaxID=556327 RepID=A0ABN0VLR6_9GAMM|nr:glutaredoxin family protein [Psychrobacter aestuarii]
MHTANDTTQDIHALREQMMIAKPVLKDAASDWWLLGTVGCHLCDHAAGALAQLAAVYPRTYTYVDIADFDEDLMLVFAEQIPVILTPTARLDYPFSVMDLQSLLA